MSDTTNENYFEELKTKGGFYSSVELTKNTKGYNWSVKCAGFDSEQIKEKIVELDNFMRENYGG